MISRDDVRQLRWPFAAALLLSVAGIIVVVLAESRLDAARATRQKALADRVASQERVTKATDEEREIQQNLIEYQKMLDSGMVGRTNRLNLIERMAGIKTERKLFEMRYSIDAQRPVEYPGIKTTGAMDLVTNRMQLNMLLLHEEDFLNFLHDLQRSRQAFVSVRRCDISRNDRPATGPTVQPTLKSECTVDLINLVEATPS